MRESYKHTQIGTVILLSFGVAMLILLLAMAVTKPILPLALILGLLLIVAALFFSLSIEIRGEFVCWRFGVGLVRKQIKLADIQAVEIVKNPWWYGFGIHLTPRGWLYNVSGLRGVEIALKNGKSFRLGTDEPESLAQALNDALSSQQL